MNFDAAIYQIAPHHRCCYHVNNLPWMSVGYLCDFKRTRYPLSSPNTLTINKLFFEWGVSSLHLPCYALIQLKVRIYSLASDTQWALLLEFNYR